MLDTEKTGFIKGKMAPIKLINNAHAQLHQNMKFNNTTAGYTNTKFNKKSTMLSEDVTTEFFKRHQETITKQERK